MPDKASPRPMIKLPFKALLFDLDGTLVNSLPAVERAWAQWSIEHGLDPDVIVPQIHGRRAADSIAILGPHLDQEAAFRRLEHLEATDTTGVVPMPGALDFLAQLENIPWGIVTSGTRAIADPRLLAGGVTPPSVFVAAEDVQEGKPNPAPFLEGIRRLGISPDDIVAFEDTLAGVRSAKAAGLRTISLTPEGATEADAAIADYLGLRVEENPDGGYLLLIP